MANRWQIMQKRTDRGIERTTTNDEIEMRKIVRDLQRSSKTLYIVVKDRVKNRRGMVWKRSESTEIDWWILADAQPEITFKK